MMEEKNKKNVAVVMASNTISVTANGLWIMFMPLYFSSSGMNLAHIGLIIGLSTLTKAACQFSGGVLSDRYGRKPIVIAGRCISAGGICAIVLSVLQINNLISAGMLAGIGYLIIYAGSGLRGPATSMLLMESSEAKEKGQNYMVAERVLPSLPPALTVLVGSMLYARGQYGLLVCVGLIGYIFATIVVWSGIRETLNEYVVDSYLKRRISLKPDSFLVLLAVAFILDGVSAQGVSWYIPLYLEDLGVEFYGILISLSTLIIALFGLLSGYLVDRYGGRSALIPAWVLLSVVVFLFGFVTEPLLLLSLYCVWVALDTVDTAVPPVLISNHYPSSEGGTRIGWFSSVKSITLFVGPILSGYLVIFGESFPFYFKAIANSLAALVIVRIANVESDD